MVKIGSVTIAKRNESCIVITGQGADHGLSRLLMVHAPYWPGFGESKVTRSRCWADRL